MKYLKVWTDLRHNLRPFSDAEIGRLFIAMMEYAECGTVPDLRGNERYIWETAKAEIDRQRDAYQKKCEVNRINGASRTQSHPVAANGPQSQQDYKTKDKTKTEEKEGTKKRVISAPRFTPPTVEEVEAYCLERQNGIDPQSFVDFYTANGWVQGRQGKPIRDWKACIRTWEQREQKQSKINDPFAGAKEFFREGGYIDI